MKYYSSHYSAFASILLQNWVIFLKKYKNIASKKNVKNYIQKVHQLGWKKVGQLYLIYISHWNTYKQH